VSRRWSLVAALLLLTVVAGFAAQPAAACQACFGDPNDPETKGVSQAVFFLLGVIGLVQVGFVSLFWQFRQRAKSIEERKSRFRILRGGIHR
jgi:hypothetical protein